MLATSDGGSIVGETPAELRRRSGTSQRPLSKALGIHQTGVSRTEFAGSNPKVNTGQQYLHVLGATWRDLAALLDHAATSSTPSSQPPGDSELDEATQDLPRSMAKLMDMATENRSEIRLLLDEELEKRLAGSPKDQSRGGKRKKKIGTTNS